MQSLKWCIGWMTLPLLLTTALYAAPLHAQSNTTIKRVGILSGFGCEGSLVNFGQRLAELGWVEGKNLITDCISTTRLEELSTRSAELVSRRPDVLVSSPTLYN
jgi:hypothetical protein